MNSGADSGINSIEEDKAGVDRSSEEQVGSALTIAGARRTGMESASSSASDTVKSEPHNHSTVSRFWKGKCGRAR